MKILAALAASGLLILGASAQNAEVTTTTSGHYELCSAIHGAKISTSDSQDVGTIDDLLIDPREGRIVTIVTSVDNRLIPVPWTAVTVGADMKVITVNTTRERFITAPTIERTQIATFSPELFQRSDTFFRESGGNAQLKPGEQRPGINAGQERRDLNAQNPNNMPGGNRENPNLNQQNKDKSQRNLNAEQRNENRRENGTARNKDEQAQPGSSPALNNRRTAHRDENNKSRQAEERSRGQNEPAASASPGAMTTPNAEKSSTDQTGGKREKTESKSPESKATPSTNSASSPSGKMPGREKQSSTSGEHKTPGERKATPEKESHQPAAHESSTPKEAGPQ